MIFPESFQPQDSFNPAEDKTQNTKYPSLQGGLSPTLLREISPPFLHNFYYRNRTSKLKKIAVCLSCF